MWGVWKKKLKQESTDCMEQRFSDFSMHQSHLGQGTSQTGPHPSTSHPQFSDSVDKMSLRCGTQILHSPTSSGQGTYFENYLS